MVSSSKEILDEIIEVFSLKVGNGNFIKADSHLIRDTGLDSLQIMELIAVLEDRFEVNLPLESLASFETVENLADYIHQQISK